MNDSVPVTSAPARRKRLLRFAAVVVVSLANVIAAASAVEWFFSPDVLDRDVAIQIRRTTGFATTIDGHARLRLFPQPRIEIRNIGFSDATGAVRIEAAALTAYLRILPLLVGRIEVGRATLYQPNIAIALDRRPETQESALGRAVATSASPERAAADATLLGLIDIVDGTAHLERRGAQADISIDDINLRVDWPSVYASADLSGRMTVRGEPLRVQAWLSQPIELLRGGQSASILRLKSNILNLWTSGRVSAVPRLQYSGRMFATAASLRKLAELAGYSFARHGSFADLDVRCDVDFKADEAALTNLYLSLDGNEYEGNLAVQDDNGIPSLSGTLASNLLDVTPFIAGFPKPNGADGLWNHERVDLADLSFADLDLRVSASRLRLYDMEIDDAALSLMTKPGLIDLAVAEATANHGTIKGRVSLSSKEQTLELHATGIGKDIDIKPMVFGLPSKRPLSGSLSTSIAIDSTGADFDLLMQGLAGRAQVAVTGGEVKGIDLAATLRNAGPKQPGEKLDIADGTTPLGQMTFDLRIANGVAEIEQGQLSAPNMQLSFVGNADVGHRMLDLSALAQTPADSAKQRIEATQLRFDLKGPWSDVRLFKGQPDPRLPLPPQHSGALPNAAMSYAPAPE